MPPDSDEEVNVESIQDILGPVASVITSCV